MSVFGVFIDHNRHTCIRIDVARRYTRYIAMDSDGIRVSKASHDVFEARWQELPTYPLPQAAANYLCSMSALVELTPEARACLTEIRDNAHPSLDNIKERIMNEETKPVPKKTAVAKPKAKAAPAKKVVAKPKAKAAPAKPAPKDKAATSGAGRPSPYAGKGIKPLVKNSAEANLRAGSKRAAMLDMVLKAKKIDDVIGKTVNVGDESHAISSSNIKGMLERKHIALV